MLVSFNLDSTSELEPKVSRRFVENDTLFYEKRYVVLWKTIRCFMENDTLFYEKRYVVLWKTSRCFMKSEPLFCAKYPIFF